MRELFHSLFTGVVFFGVLALCVYFWPVSLTISGLLFVTWVGAFIREFVLTGGNPPPKTYPPLWDCETCGDRRAPLPPRNREVS